METILNQTTKEAAQQAVAQQGLRIESVRVEDELGFPLVERIRGGSTGSGSVLTEKGKHLMTAYDQFSEHLNKEARQLYRKLFEANDN